jgi:hypothetical protein
MGVEELLLDSKDPYAAWMGCCICSTPYAERSFKKKKKIGMELFTNLIECVREYYRFNWNVWYQQKLGARGVEGSRHMA